MILLKNRFNNFDVLSDNFTCPTKRKEYNFFLPWKIKQLLKGKVGLCLFLEVL